MSNANYKKMAKVESRTALRDLNDLLEMGVLVKTGKLKGTRYHLHTSDADSHAE
jgi:Fic family protein